MDLRSLYILYTEEIINTKHELQTGHVDLKGSKMTISSLSAFPYLFFIF